MLKINRKTLVGFLESIEEFNGMENVTRLQPEMESYNGIEKWNVLKIVEVTGEKLRYRFYGKAPYNLLGRFVYFRNEMKTFEGDGCLLYDIYQFIGLLKFISYEFKEAKHQEIEITQKNDN